MAVGKLSIKRLVMTLTFAFAVVAAPFASVTNVSAATRTWDGGGSDNKFSTAANWSTDTAPVAGDDLVFNVAAATPGEQLDNDIDAAFGSLTSTTASSSQLNGYVLTKVLKLQDGATWNVSENLNVRANVGVESAGSFTVDAGYGPSIINAVGLVTAKSGSLMTSIPVTASGLVIEKSASMVCIAGDKTITYPVTLGGGTGTTKPLVDYSKCIGGSGSSPSTKLTLNTVILQDDAEIGVYHPNVVEVKSLTKNGHSLVRTDSSTGQLITPDGVVENQEKTTPLDGDSPLQDEQVVYKETAILNGTRGTVTVWDGGTLRGNGTVQDLYVSGIVAPGNSPGKITVQQDLLIGAGGVFEAEILNKDAYDQLVVQSGGTVDVDGGSLALSFLVGGKVTQGETFTIIDNQGSDPVGGTFAGLAEGARITIGSAIFAISYVGGTGNDVVLTALTTANAPGTPNTGFRLVMANPAIVAVIGIAAAGALLLVKRRLSQR